MSEDEIVRDYLRHGAGQIEWYPDRPAMTDPQGAKALAAALNKTLPRRGDLVSRTDWENAASRILGKHGVFTADGRVFAAGIEKIVAAEREQRAEIAALRAALEGLAAAAGEVVSDRDDNYCFSCHDTLPCAHDALRAALATAKEASGHG